MQAVTWITGPSLLPGQGRLLWWHYSEGRVFQCRLSHGEWEQVYRQGKVGCCGGTIVRAGCSRCRLSHGERDQVYCQGNVGCCGGTIVRAGCSRAGCHMENGTKFTARPR